MFSWKKTLVRQYIPGIGPPSLLLDLSVLQQLFGKVIGKLFKFGLLPNSKSKRERFI